MDPRFTGDLNDLATHLTDIATRFQGVADSRFAAMLPDLETAIVEAYRAVTPNQTGHLADSTTVESFEIDGSSASFIITQPAESQPNVDGSGGGQHYVQWVLPPGRGEITAPSKGPYSTGKKALAGPGFGPVKHVRAYPGSAYPYLADPVVQTAIELAQARWSDDTLSFLFEGHV